MMRVIFSGGDAGGLVKDLPNKIGESVNLDGLNYLITDNETVLDNETAFVAVYIGD